MKPGGAYRMLSDNGKVVAVIGEILEMEPPRRMVTSFRMTALSDPASKVTYTLKETPEGTEFQLITENIVAGTKMEKSMASGGEFIVKNFKAFVETGKVTFAARMELAMYGLMAPMTPKSMSADRWPLSKVRS